MNDMILMAWSFGAISTLSIGALCAELWRSRERWRREAERLRDECRRLHVLRNIDGKGDR